MMLQLMEHLNQEGKYIALYVNVEAAQAWRNNIAKLNQTIMNEFRIQAKVTAKLLIIYYLWHGYNELLMVVDI
jgi:hypothetical protein